MSVLEIDSDLWVNMAWNNTCFTMSKKGALASILEVLGTSITVLVRSIESPIIVSLFRFSFRSSSSPKQASAALSAIVDASIRVKVRASFCEHGRLFVTVQYITVSHLPKFVPTDTVPESYSGGLIGGTLCSVGSFVCILWRHPRKRRILRQ